MTELRERHTPPKRGWEAEERSPPSTVRKKKRRESDEDPAVARYLWHTPVNVWRERREVNQVTCRECGAKCTLLCSRCSNIGKNIYYGLCNPTTGRDCLNQSMRVQSGERLHKCSTCGKAFAAYSPPSRSRPLRPSPPSLSETSPAPHSLLSSDSDATGPSSLGEPNHSPALPMRGNAMQPHAHWPLVGERSLQCVPYGQRSRPLRRSAR